MNGRDTAPERVLSRAVLGEQRHLDDAAVPDRQQVRARLDILQSTCPSRTWLARIANKWTAMIVIVLSGQRMRFGDLRNFTRVQAAREEYDAGRTSGAQPLRP
jgi:hypothetical protein